MNRIYKYALSQLSVEEQTLLKTAQKSWLTFRDNHCKVYGKMYHGSPGMVMMLAVCRKELTLHRIEELKVLSER
ncbi:DUF1311 domain-containing protein [Rhodocytophaga rosea]|uniref:DUF1311 domain-containing protein n=1 Tax=Rhodocytophaga rosea TaxID=2704465 RepID=A0A6C0GW89_9BACT|nr:lysozyme inhibitor LprI family protein [Rhodocytophaga rosea]QHT71833.1 DUF1311 domain-containing protein [Rhodocytophaga rosea]